MPPKLTPEEIVTLQILKQKGQSQTQIAQTLGVTEGAVRYHLRRQGQQDGRRDKPCKAAPLAQVIDAWVAQGQAGGHESQREPVRPANVQGLHEWLCLEHGYQGSYKSVLRFVRARYPQPRLRPYRRVETPAGAQGQVDWGEFGGIDLGDGPETLYGFVVVLSHSRREALIWCRCMDQLAWHHAHNEAFQRLGGIPAVLRIDNLKTGVGWGAGPWGELNAAYRSYGFSLGSHIDAYLPRCPKDKGKASPIGWLRARRGGSPGRGMRACWVLMSARCRGCQMLACRRQTAR